MRVAALYDVHGNLPALEAVLQDVRREAPDLIVLGGDMAAGPMPREALERLAALGEAARFIRGNTDRKLVDHYDGNSTDAEGIWMRRDAWAAQRLTQTQRDFLASLPATVIVDVDRLGPTLFCHASPRNDEEPITRLTPDLWLDEMLGGVVERVIVCGHTHVQLDRSHAGHRVVNAGSVGMPHEGRPGAYWALLGPEVQLRRSDYDLVDAGARIRATGYPGADEVIARLAAEDPSAADRAAAAIESAARPDG